MGRSNKKGLKNRLEMLFGPKDSKRSVSVGTGCSLDTNFAVGTDAGTGPTTSVNGAGDNGSIAVSSQSSSSLSTDGAIDVVTVQNAVVMRKKIISRIVKHLAETGSLWSSITDLIEAVIDPSTHDLVDEVFGYIVVHCTRTFIIQPSSELGSDDLIITLAPRIPICKDHSSANGCSVEDCLSLHLCLEMLHGLCTDHSVCVYNHFVMLKHNKEILANFDLDQVHPEMIKKIILKGFRGSVMPPLCADYNGKGGCGAKKQCKALHLCEEFILGKDHDRQCKKEHDIYALDHNVKLFSLYGISSNVSAVELAIRIRDALPEHKRRKFVFKSELPAVPPRAQVVSSHQPWTNGYRQGEGSNHAASNYSQAQYFVKNDNATSPWDSTTSSGSAIHPGLHPGKGSKHAAANNPKIHSYAKNDNGATPRDSATSPSTTIDREFPKGKESKHASPKQHQYQPIAPPEALYHVKNDYDTRVREVSTSSVATTEPELRPVERNNHAVQSDLPQAQYYVKNDFETMSGYATSSQNNDVHREMASSKQGSSLGRGAHSSEYTAPVGGRTGSHSDSVPSSAFKTRGPDLKAFALIEQERAASNSRKSSYSEATRPRTMSEDIAEIDELNRLESLNGNDYNGGGIKTEPGAGIDAGIWQREYNDELYGSELSREEQLVPSQSDDHHARALQMEYAGNLYDDELTQDQMDKLKQFSTYGNFTSGHMDTFPIPGASGYSGSSAAGGRDFKDHQAIAKMIKGNSQEPQDFDYARGRDRLNSTGNQPPLHQSGSSGHKEPAPSSQNTKAPGSYQSSHGASRGATKYPLQQPEGYQVAMFEQVCHMGLTKAKCPKYNRCNRIHLGKEFEWQILDGDDWSEIGSVSNFIEKRYTDPSADHVVMQASQFPKKLKTIVRNAAWYLGLHSFTMTEKGTGETLSVRRLCTPSYVRAESLNSVSVKLNYWVWYFYNDAAWQQFSGGMPQKHFRRPPPAL